MPAYICTKPAGSCKNCNHFRMDEDRGEKACFAYADTKISAETVKANGSEKEIVKNFCDWIKGNISGFDGSDHGLLVVRGDKWEDAFETYCKEQGI